MLNNTMNDAFAADQARDAHADGCIECQGEGCTGCPAGSACDLPRLVEHEREWMCPGCVAAFDAHVANRCTGDVCNCAVPLACDAEETTPTAPMSDREIAKLDPLGVFRRLAAVAALVLACVSGVACAHGGSSPAVQVEQVGQLSAGPSTWAAPVHATTPPPSFEIAGSADDDDGAAPVVTAADAGPDAPAIEEKNAHGF